jgi:uncharacterized protein (TIGR04255 family)
METLRQPWQLKLVGIDSVPNSLPNKLKNDAILEAILEIRFEPDPNLVAEVLFGRFADVPEWRGFKQVRLPTADIPAPIRRANPGLRYQPSIELVSADGGVSVRIGPQVIAYSRRGNYPGWGLFGVELAMVVDSLYRILPNAHVSRLGLRYINALRSDAHGISNVSDMDIAITVADSNVTSSLNLNFKTDVNSNHEAMSRIATVDLAEGSIPDNTSIVVDIDVYTESSFSTRQIDEVKSWVVAAHQKEKESFFKVLGEKATQRLREN